MSANLGRYNAAPKTVGENEEQQLLIDSTGNLKVVTTPNSTTSSAKAEDAPHVSSDVGSFVLGVRNENLTTTTSTEGDYSQISTDRTGAVKIVTTARSGTDRSITATTTSQVLMAANLNRTRFFIKNDTAIVVWVNLGATAVAAAGTGNISIAANGGYLELSGTSEAVNIIATSTTAAVTAREY